MVHVASEDDPSYPWPPGLQPPNLTTTTLFLLRLWLMAMAEVHVGDNPNVKQEEPQASSKEMKEAKAVSLKRHRPEGETQLKENGRFDSQHAAAEASEVLRDIDDLDLIIVAMRYLGVPEEMSVQDHPATWQMTQSSGLFPECVARVPVSLWGSGGWRCVCSTLRLCSQPSAAVRNRL